ncbi:MAG: hypothetical protein AVDCRST_MAG10-1614 [uncultured Acidimicrobiales bacterium]|uniref:YncE family protein n=1 Tax=uncultured Acidimicrobiales bacterium TaxID=310071 RepID=A0A6J4I544_9ACTN|nr:MAG: hypothetical protein AVDCRST_MAG10-1614 [uncultured Acidimicrobiales bacterium]
MLLLAVLMPATTLIAGAAAPVAAAGAPPMPGGFTAVTPARTLDTRIGVGAAAAKVGPGRSIDLQVTGMGGVPSTGVAAVALNLTVTEPTAVGFLTVYPTGETRPLASSANFVASQTVANAVVARIGTGGKVTIYNSSGTSHLVADVAGWHASARDAGSAFTPVAPVRLLDSRTTQAVGPGGTVRVPVAVPRPATLTAVALNVTATEPSTGGFLTVHPSGTTLPLASNLNVVAGQTRANFVAVKLADGAVDIYNSKGTTHVVVDLLGYWSPGSNSRMTAVTPTRLMDTRTGLGRAGAVQGQGTALLQLPGAGPVPAGRAAAVVLNVTATAPTTGGHLTVYPSGDSPPPLASNLNFVAGETVPNLVIVPLGRDGAVKIYNSNGDTHIVVDVVGWFDLPAERLDIERPSTFHSDVAIDPTSTYAYVTNTAYGRVEVLRLVDGVFEEPIPVGSQPLGLDLTPDGSRLYVANRGSTYVSVVDVAARSELRRVPIPSERMSDRPYSIAVLANGKALLTTTFDGSGFGAYMYEIDLATDAVKLRTDFWIWSGKTTEYTSIRASGDRTAAVIVVGDNSPGALFRYDAPTDAFSPRRETWDFISYGATNADGSVTLVNDGGMLFDRSLQPLGTVGCGSGGVAVNRQGSVGYGFGAYYESATGIIGTIAVCDLVNFRVTRVIPIGPVAGLGRLQVSPDGRTLLGITDTGLVLVRL